MRKLGTENKRKQGTKTLCIYKTLITKPLCRCVGLFLLDGNRWSLYHILLDGHKERVLCKENKDNDESIEAEGRIRITFTNRAAEKTPHTVSSQNQQLNHLRWYLATENSIFFL